MSVIDSTKEVQILTKNCIDSDSVITSSHGGTTSYLIDRDLETKWTSVGAARDITVVTLNITFKVGSTETEFVFNRLMILNSNVKNITLEWYRASDATYHTVVSDDLGGDYSCHTFGAVKSSRIRLTLTRTQSPNQEKEIGEIIISRLRYVLGEGFTQYNVSHVPKEFPFNLGDGGLHLANTRSLGSRTTRYMAQCLFTLLSRNDYENLLCLKNEGEPFIWYPESITRPDEVWYVHWVGPLIASYSTTYVGNGYNVQMQLVEV